MSILYLMVPIALAIAGGALVAFIWSVRSGQYDDLVTPAHRVLDEFRRSETKTKGKERDQK